MKEENITQILPPKHNYSEFIPYYISFLCIYFNLSYDHLVYKVLYPDLSLLTSVMCWCFYSIMFRLKFSVKWSEILLPIDIKISCSFILILWQRNFKIPIPIVGKKWKIFTIRSLFVKYFLKQQIIKKTYSCIYL